MVEEKSATEDHWILLNRVKSVNQFNNIGYPIDFEIIGFYCHVPVDADRSLAANHPQTEINW